MPKGDLNFLANSFRKEMGEDAFSPVDIFAMALRLKNTSIVFAKLGKNISGVFYRNEKSSTIVINSEMTLGRQRFSMAHEIYHSQFDKDLGVIFCPKNIKLGDDNEKRANRFAVCLLMPEYGITERVNELKQEKGRLGIEEIIQLEQYYGVSHNALLIRLKELELISHSEYERFSDSITAKAEMLNYDTSLYKPTNEEKTIGYYIQLARKLHSEGKMSDSKFKEILEDAFVGELADEDSVVLGEDTFE